MVDKMKTSADVTMIFHNPIERETLFFDLNEEIKIEPVAVLTIPNTGRLGGSKYWTATENADE